MVAEEAVQHLRQCKRQRHQITFCEEEETSQSFISGDPGGESFIVILLTRDRKPGELRK